jgi:hypothetical protein
MLSVRKQDPTFIKFVPKNAEEAVDRYMRCKRRGLKQYLIPECLISCAQGLSPEELEKFERWIVNPEGNTDSKMELVETKQLQADNAAIFEENARRVESLLQPGEALPEILPLTRQRRVESLLPEIPPLPMPSLLELSMDDEKRPGTPLPAAHRSPDISDSADSDFGTLMMEAEQVLADTPPPSDRTDMPRAV